MNLTVCLLLLHLLWCLFLWGLLRRKVVRLERGMFPLVLFVPVWGTGSALLLCKKPPLNRQWSVAQSLYVAVDTTSFPPTELPYHAAELVPLEEALLLDTAAQRRRLMLLLLADDPAQQYALLELARRNPDSEVAHYAAAAMAQAGKRADQALDAVQQQYRAAPLDAAVQTAYQQQLQRMLKNGLVQGRAAELLCQKLAELLQTVMQETPTYDVGCQLAETQLALHDTAAAERTITCLLERWPQRESPWLLRLRCAAACRDGDAVQAVLREIRERHIWLSANGREALQFWQTEPQGGKPA